MIRRADRIVGTHGMQSHTIPDAGEVEDHSDVSETAARNWESLGRYGRGRLGALNEVRWK